jgi:predicted acylesterase/phospholipase RssA
VGAIFELGALRALDEAIDGLRIHDLDVYVGVSAGGFIAASLANRVSTAAMCRIFMGHEGAEHAFDPDKLLTPAYREYLARASTVPGIVMDSLKQLLTHPFDTSASALIGALGTAIPSGIFDNDSLHRFMQQVFEADGRTNDFRQLERRLYIVAVNLDNGSAVRFGSEGYDDVPISRAVQASAALPGMYPPVRINDAYYVDGALRRTLHASAALDEGVDLLLGVNPLVPFASAEQEELHIPVRKLIRGGLPMILSQTFRSMIQSRMNVAFKKYRRSHPDADLLLIEPNQSDEQIFFTNIFSFASRSALCDHAYQTTRKDLLQRADQLDRALERHGMKINRETLAEENRSLNDSVGEAWFGSSQTSRQLSQALDDLEIALAERT